MLEAKLGAGDLGPAAGVSVGFANIWTRILKICNLCFLEQ